MSTIEPYSLCKEGMNLLGNQAWSITPRIGHAPANDQEAGFVDLVEQQPGA